MTTLNIPRIVEGGDAEIGRIFGVKASSVSQSVARSGEFAGIRPLRISARRRVWLAEDVEALFTRQSEPRA